MYKIILFYLLTQAVKRVKMNYGTYKLSFTPLKQTGITSLLYNQALFRRARAMNKNSLLALVLLCTIFAVIGGIFIKIGMNMNARNDELKKICTEEIQSIVTDFYVTGEVYWDPDEDIPTKRDNRVYYPIFEYTVNNETYRQQSPTGEGVKRADAGENITIMYNPANPDEYYVPTGAYATKNGTLTIGFGSFMIVFAAGALFAGGIQIAKFIKKS